MLSWCGAAALGVAACWSGRAEAADAPKPHVLVPDKIVEVTASVTGPEIDSFVLSFTDLTWSSGSATDTPYKLMNGTTEIASEKEKETLAALAVCGGEVKWQYLADTPKDQPKGKVSTGTIKFIRPKGVNYLSDSDTATVWTDQDV